MSFPERAAIDTNVLIVANGKSDQATDECVIAAIDFLQHAESDCVVLIDESGEIFTEYERYCSYRGQPGVGDRFFLHLYRAQADVTRVQKIAITPDGEGSYEEVPPELSRFDPSDKKFIAVVLTDGESAPIVNCVDSDWSLSAADLAACGVQVHELCPTCLKSH